MKKALAITVQLAFAVFAVPGIAQIAGSVQQLGIKGDNIGESLADFRAHNKAILSDPLSSPRLFPRCSSDAPIADNANNPFMAHDTLVETLNDFKEEWNQAHIPIDIVCTTTEAFSTTTIAGSSTTIKYGFKDNILVYMEGEFQSSDYAQVRAAVINKYGQPNKVEIKVYENKMGATYKGESASWQRSLSSLTLSELSGNLELGTIVVVDKTFVEATADVRQHEANSDF